MIQSGRTRRIRSRPASSVRALGSGIALVAAATLVVACAGAPDDAPTSSVSGRDPAVIGTEATTVPETPAAAGAPAPIDLIGATAGVHDPMAVDTDGYWLFSTGPGISVRRSDDLARWEHMGPVFPADATPTWWAATVAGYSGRDVWAPEVSWFGGQWHLYYSISLFGQQTAAIGHATNATLDPAEPSFRWVDHGPVVVSAEGDEWVAIDATVALDEHGEPWLAWGSGLGGIWIQRLDAASGELGADEATRIAKLDARRMIEAPFLVHRSGWWYLFTSRGRCCAGVDSTYRITVGRSRQLTGPYVDADDQPLIGSGGTLVLGSEGSVIGPGHNSVLTIGRDWWLVHHYYDGDADGDPTLGIRPLAWDADGWPVVPGPTASAPAPQIPPSTARR